MDNKTIEFIKKVIKASNHSSEVVDLSVDFIIENHLKTSIPVYANGKKFLIPEKEYDQMKPIIQSGNQSAWGKGVKIAMIKAIRELTGCGLIEGRDIVQDMDNWR